MSLRKYPRLLAFLMFLLFAVAVNLIEALFGKLVFEELLMKTLKVINDADQTWRPSIFISWESASFVASLLATLIVVKIQRRNFAAYGFRMKGGLTLFARGCVWGAIPVVLLVSAIAALGGFTFGHLAMSGTKLIVYTIGWLAAMLGIGLAEEAQFRATGQFTLAEAIGPWPAIAVISALFGAIHYFQKPMENLADAASVTLLGAFMGFTVLRTGSIWFAAGFHMMFDCFALFVFGAPNSGNHGQPLPTKLLTGTYHGPAWLTGGPLGVEASWLVFPIIALLFLSFHLATRRRAYNAPDPGQLNT